MYNTKSLPFLPFKERFVRDSQDEDGGRTLKLYTSCKSTYSADGARPVGNCTDVCIKLFVLIFFKRTLGKSSASD